MPAPTTLVSDWILSQFSGSTTLQLKYTTLFGRLDEIYNLLVSLLDERTIEEASGAQLDICGRIVGVERPYREQDEDTIFTLKDVADPDDADKALSDTGPPATGGYMQSFDGITDVSDPTLKETDANYVKLIKAKAIANSAGGLITDIYTFIFDAFDVDCSIEVLQTGEVRITVDDFLSQKERRYIEEYGPKHAGVRIEFMNWEY